MGGARRIENGMYKLDKFSRVFVFLSIFFFCFVRNYLYDNLIECLKQSMKIIFKMKQTNKKHTYYYGNGDDGQPYWWYILICLCCTNNTSDRCHNSFRISIDSNSLAHSIPKWHRASHVDDDDNESISS